MRFNGDSGNNYTQVSLSGRNAATQSTRSIGINHILAGTVGGTTGTANAGGVINILIPEYRNTNYVKRAMCESGSLADDSLLSSSVGWIVTGKL